MRPRLQSNLLGVAMMTVALPLLAQDPAPTAPAGSHRVFILDFGGATPSRPSDASDLNEFVPSLLQWRLRADNRILASRLHSIACSGDDVARNIRALATSNEVYYTVQGSVMPRTATVTPSNPQAGVAPPEMVLSYELDKVTNCAPEMLLRRSVSVTSGTALDEVSVMADLIALKLGKVFAESPSAVGRPSDIAGSDQDLNAHLDILLCRTPTQTSTLSCSEQAGAAIPLLRELIKRHPKDAGNLYWLGRAQADAGLPLDASKSFDAALKSSVNAPPQQRWPGLERSADALYGLDSYNAAAVQYQVALDTLAKASEADDGANAARIRLKLARVLRFDGDRQGAFDTLLKGMPSGDDAKPYVLELRDLVASLQPKELTWADQRLDAPDAATLDPNVKVLVYNREAERDLNGRGDKVEIDAELKKAEALAGSVEAAIQVATLWWRSQWYAAQGMMDQAGKSIDESLKLNNEIDPTVRYQAAVFYYVQASHLGENDPKVPMLWQRAATIAEPLLTENKRTTPPEILRYAESIYRNANHNINQDETTRSVYEAILKRYPSDFAVRRGLLGLYTDFLKNPARALESARATYVLPETRHDPSTLLDIVEVYVLNAEYDGANDVLDSLASTSADESVLNNLGYSAVSYFYQTWAALARHDMAGATRAQNGWYLAMVKYRNNDPQDFIWRFDGAVDRLNKLEGLQITDKRTLRHMILAMTDVAVPLPHQSQ